MSRSFGNRSGGMGGGGGGSSGGMLRTVHRAVRGGFGGANTDPFSHSTTNTATSTTTAANSNRKTYRPTSPNLSLSTSTAQSPFSSFNNPVSATSTVPIWGSCSSPSGSDDFDWECVDGGEFERGSSYYDEFVFGSVPSSDEVHHAVSALQQVIVPGFSSQYIKDRFAYNSDKDVADDVTSPVGFMRRVSSVGGEMDWIEPSVQLRNPTILPSYGRDRVFDAFHMLQNEPCIQRMVVSLSSDRAVWDAVSNNEVVRELRESLGAAARKIASEEEEEEELDPGSDDSNAATSILSWIFDNTKAKVMELLEKLSLLVNDLFQPPENEKIGEGERDPFEEKLRVSFFLSVMVLLLVAVSRGYKGSA